MRPCLVSLLLLASGCATLTAERPPLEALRAPAREAPVRLRFAPEEGRAQEEVARLVLTEGGVVRERMALQLRSTFTRQGQGFRLTQQVTGGEGAPAAGALERVPLEVELTEDGTFVRLLDADALASALAGTGPEALEAQARREWEARYGQLLGRALRPGDVLYSVEVVPTASAGPVAFVLARTVVGTRPGPRGEALVLALGCHGTAEGLPAAEVAPLLEAAGQPRLEPSVACEGEQRVGTGAFLPLSTRLVLRARPTGADGRPVPVVVERNVELTGATP